MPESSHRLRDLRSHEDYEECVRLQCATWGDGFHELVPPAMLMVAQKVGGLAVGAYDAEGTLDGFVYGVTGIVDGRPVHWSHMLAVRADRRDRGIGRMLKEHQRARMRAAGVPTIRWTYDPLIARNAHLNLAVLGATVLEYVENMYAEDPLSVMDGIIGTDRFVVASDTAETRPGRAPAPRMRSAWRLFTEPDTEVAFPDEHTVAVPTPPDIQALKLEDPDRARHWRRATRRAFLHYLGAGYRVAGFEREAVGGGTYVLVQRAECSVQSAE